MSGRSGTREGRRAGLARAIAAALVVAAALSGCTPPLVQRAEDDIVEVPSTARFYRPPGPLPQGGPLPHGGPGALLRTEHILGSPLGSTGLVVIPASKPPEGGRTIVSWGHPTTGGAQKCAPSRAIDPFDLVEGLTDFLNRGYIVVYTDYTGMGTPGPTPT